MIPDKNAKTDQEVSRWQMVLRVKWESESDFNIFSPLRGQPQVRMTSGGKSEFAVTQVMSSPLTEIAAAAGLLGLFLINSPTDVVAAPACFTAAPASLVAALPSQARPNFLDWCDLPACWTEPGHFLPSGCIALRQGENRFWGFAVCLSNHFLCRDRKVGLPHGVSRLIFFYFLIFVPPTHPHFTPQCGSGTL